MKIKKIRTSIPGYRPPTEDRVTIIRFSEADDEASVFTYNKALMKKLDWLSEDRPDEVHIMDAQSINGVENREYLIPKRWVKVTTARSMTEMSLAEKAEKMRQYRLQKTAQKSEEALRTIQEA